MAADRPYPPLRGLTVCEGDSGCLEFGRVQGGAIPLPLTDWGGRDFCRRSTMLEAQRPVPGSLSVTGHQSGPGPGRTAPGRPPQRAKLPDMRQRPSIKAAAKNLALGKARTVSLLYLCILEVTSRGRNETDRYLLAGSARRFRFLLAVLQDRPTGPLLERVCLSILGAAFWFVMVPFSFDCHALV